MDITIKSEEQQEQLVQKEQARNKAIQDTTDILKQRIQKLQMALKMAEGHVTAADSAAKWARQKLKDSTDTADKKVNRTLK